MIMTTSAEEIVQILKLDAACFLLSSHQRARTSKGHRQNHAQRPRYLHYLKG